MNRTRIAGRLMQLDLALALLFSFAALLVTLADVPLLFRLPLVVALVLFLPGYGLLSVLVTGTALSALERVMIAIGASIAVTVASGLAMAALGISIGRESWVVVLTAISVVAIILAWGRRLVHGMDGPRPVVPGMPLRQAALGLIGILIIADAVLVSRLVAADQLNPPPAQLWLVERSDLTSADLGVRAGPDGGSYRVQVSSAGKVLSEFDVPLEPSAVWRTTLVFSPEQRRLPVVARLYEGGSDIESRYVVLQSLPSPAASAPADGAPSNAP